MQHHDNSIFDSSPLLIRESLQKPRMRTCECFSFSFSTSHFYFLFGGLKKTLTYITYLILQPDFPASLKDRKNFLILSLFSSEIRIVLFEWAPCISSLEKLKIPAWDWQNKIWRMGFDLIDHFIPPLTSSCDTKPLCISKMRKQDVDTSRRLSGFDRQTPSKDALP